MRLQLHVGMPNLFLEQFKQLLLNRLHLHNMCQYTQWLPINFVIIFVINLILWWEDEKKCLAENKRQ